MSNSNHGLSGYKSGCRCEVCKSASADAKRKVRANAAKRKIDAQLAALAEQRRLEREREEHDAAELADHLECQRKILFPTAEEEHQQFLEYEAWCVAHGADRAAFD